MPNSLYDAPPASTASTATEQRSPTAYKPQFVNGMSKANIKKVAMYEFGVKEVHSVGVEPNGKDWFIILKNAPLLTQKFKFEESWKVAVKVIA